jgi:TetR/AcrR family transcriptional repressor of nem operon
MARTRSFDEKLVVEAAMRVFWQKGYVATSMSDIYEATGLKAGSVYAAFGDKEQLFHKAFDHYTKRFYDTLPKDQIGLPAIESWLQIQADLATSDPTRAGCLIINTFAESLAHTPETQAKAQARIDEVYAFFSENLRHAINRGEIAQALDIAAAGDALVGSIVAIMILGRSGAPATTIQNVSKFALKGLTAEI